uniref:50S ribosomal protein L6 n=1 Tax=Spongospora subterranea TaxID=70186 RepID=A0A096XTX5_9EUKA|nr:50S ribosomal protein L6 [Spongospora subterranea]AIK19917.1 50S ribosomal protein L6 [Spongospora subterranea]
MVQTNKLIFSKSISFNSHINIITTKTKVFIKGPLGVLLLELPKGLFFQKVNSTLNIFSSIENKIIVLTYFKIVLQKIKGVEIGFFEILLINGVGWRVSLNKNILTFFLGFSHFVKYTIRPKVEITVLDKQKFKIFGLDLGDVQQTVSDLYLLRAYDTYKGKGIQKQDHIQKLKLSSKFKS